MTDFIMIRISKVVPAVILAWVAMWVAPYAGARTLKAPQVSETLRPPAGDILRLTLVGKGVQIYQCTTSADLPAHFEWKLLGPEAKLFDSKGHIVGKHYAGPTWESTDGSTVVGEVRAHEDATDAGSIPSLLLNAKSVSGHGVFGDIHTIQRLKTTGGKAPGDACASANTNQTVRVPYSARYFFYVAAH